MTWSLAQAELFFALQSAGGSRNPAGRTAAHEPHALPAAGAAQFAQNYITNIYDAGYTDTLNLYDVSGLAHFELYRALEMAGNPGLGGSQ